MYRQHKAIHFSYSTNRASQGNNFNKARSLNKATNGDGFEYQYGRLIDYPKKYINKKIKSVSGSGGYFLMSYELKTE